MNIAKNIKRIRNQAGMTLIEMITSLAILALVIGGALALFNSASTSQSSTQFSSDLNAIRAAVKATYYGQGGYGTVSINPVLIAGKRVPTTMIVTGTGATAVVNHSLSGTMTATGAGANFTVALTNIPAEVCLNLLAGASGWTSIIVAGGAAQTAFPISPAIATTQCAFGTTITFTGA